MSAADLLTKRTDLWAKDFILQQQEIGARHVACWEGGGYRAFIAFEPYGETPDGKSDFRWHISVSRQDGEVPTWDDMASIVHRLKGNMPFVIGIPPRDLWMSVPGVEVLHAVQTRDENLIARWTEEAVGRRAS